MKLSDIQRNYLMDIQGWLLYNYSNAGIWEEETYHHKDLPVPIRIHIIERVIARKEYFHEDKDYLNSLKPLHKLIKEAKERKKNIQLGGGSAMYQNATHHFTVHRPD